MHKSTKSLGLKINSKKDKRKNVRNGIQEGSKQSIK
jgi:hypothetical protein